MPDIITLCGPWAHWVALGLKPIETRTHNRFRKLKGQRIGIHVSRRWDDEAAILAAPYLRMEQLYINPWEKHIGCIICTAFVADAHELNAEHSARALIDCGTVKRHGLFCVDVRRLSTPIPAKGSLGIWRFEVPDEQKVKDGH